MRELKKLPLSSPVLGPNLRSNLGPPEALRALGESYISKPIHPLIVGPALLVLDGSRRVAGMRMVLGDKSEHPVDCIVTDENPSPAQIIEINLLSAMREDVSPYDRWRGCVQWLEMTGGTQKDLAAMLKLNAGTVSNLLTPSKCIPAAQEALEAGTITITDCAAMARVPPEQQGALLALRLSGASAADVVHRSRKARNGKPAEKVSRLRCPLASGAVVQVSLDGEGGIDEAIEAAQEFVKLAKRAAERGWDAKTLEKTCAAEAKAGK